MDLPMLILILVIGASFSICFDRMALEESNRINKLAAFFEVFDDQFPMDFNPLRSRYFHSAIGCLNFCRKTEDCNSVSFTEKITGTENCKAFHLHDNRIFTFEKNLREQIGWNTYMILKMPSVDNFPVNGGWSEWQESGSCTLPCGEGTVQLIRHCDNPVPANNGLPCFGIHIKEETCNEHSCPVNGEWSPWEAADPLQCTVTCGGGQLQRSRSCNSPPPSNGGSYCIGHPSKFESCMEGSCPVNGEWGPWTDASHLLCSVTCGGGQLERIRQCNNPAPLNGGLNCIGYSTKTESCSEDPCPVHGEWGQWSAIDPLQCSVTCDEGQVQLSRSCDNPSPYNGGSNCIGNSTKTEVCINDPCPPVSVTFMASPGSVAHARSGCTLYNADASRLDLLPTKPSHFSNGYWWMDCYNSDMTQCNCPEGKATLVYYTTKANHVTCADDTSYRHGGVCI